METSFPWNISLFNALNASDTPGEFVLMAAKGLAIFSPWLVIVILILFWVFGTADSRRALMAAGVALGLGLAINFSIAFLVYVPRPFELGVGNSFLTHSLETSFPSDHMTFLGSLGFGLLLTSPLRRLGGGIISLGLATAWARIYLGVHFPLDMVASFVISLFAALMSRFMSSTLDRILFQPIEHLNTIVLRPLVDLKKNNDDR